MAISFPGPAQAGDLARCITHEADEPWPTLIEIVAYFGPADNPRRGRRVSVEISSDEFYGRRGFNAPITGDMLIRKIEQLRRK